MTKKIIEKNIKLSLEFDTYLTKHPKLYDKIPRGSCVVITVKGDTKFNHANTGHISSREGKFVEARKEDGRWTVRKFVSAQIPFSRNKPSFHTYISMYLLSLQVVV